MLTAKLPLTALAATLSLGLLSAPAGAAAKPKAAKKAKPSACQRLQGYDRAPDKDVKLMWQRADSAEFTGSKLVACVLPKGKVRTLATQEDLGTGNTHEEWVRPLEVVGRKVLLGSFSSDQYATSETYEVLDIGTGATYKLSFWCGGQMCGGSPSLGTQLGSSVLSYDKPSDTTQPPAATIVAFSPTGQQTVLDRGTSTDFSTSLKRVDATTVGWTHGSEAKTAPLPR
jgi:hypothetical protein